MAATSVSAFEVLDDASAEDRACIVRLLLSDVDTDAAKTFDELAISLYLEELTGYQELREIVLEPPATSELSPPADAHVVLFACNSCTDQFDSDHCYQVPCQHYYCDGCLNTLFRLAMTDERAYPPRCCRQQIPLEDVSLFLDSQLLKDFNEKIEELDDTAKTYCHVPTCSTYIGHANKEGSEGTCPKCSEKTCLLCKQAAHEDDCKMDKAIEGTLELAKKEGWQKCPSCGRMVELNRGCNHITCLCKAQFCYVCGITWRECTCPHFNEDRLMERADVIAERDGQNLDAVMRNLEINHGCVDHDWAFRHGAAQCDECGYRAPTFTFRCETCGTRMCRRCRYNRD